MTKYLVIQLARLGDLIQTKRLILSLAQQGELHLCVDNSLQELAALLYPDACIHGIAAHGGMGAGSSSQDVLASNYACFERLRAEKFDKVYNLNYAGVNRACARLFDAEQLCGYRMQSGQSIHSPLLRLAFRWMQARRSAPLHLVDLWGLLADNPIAPEAVNPVAHGGGKGIGIVLAGRHARRSLAPELLAPCVHTLFRAYGNAPLFFFGSRSESVLARACMDALPGSVRASCHDLTGKTDLPGLARELAGLDLLLSPDTGVLHLAAHLGVPTLSLFLSSAWCFETGAYGLGHTVIQAALACAPCLESAECSRNTACAALFGGREFLRAFGHISGQLAARTNSASGKISEQGNASGTEIPGLLVMDSSFDALGACWHLRGDAARDPDAIQRLAQRAVLGEFMSCPTGAAPHAVADALYEETDWTLPWYAHSADI